MRSIGQGGQATVELALCLPIVALIVACVVEVGAVASDHVRIWHATREAARVAAVSSDLGEIERAARASGLESVEVEVSPAPVERRYGDAATVIASYAHRPRVPLVGNLLDGFVLRARSTMRIEEP